MCATVTVFGVGKGYVLRVEINSVIFVRVNVEINNNHTWIVGVRSININK